jgi:hypothetical protein
MRRPCSIGGFAAIVLDSTEELNGPKVYVNRVSIDVFCLCPLAVSFFFYLFTYRQYFLCFTLFFMFCSLLGSISFADDYPLSGLLLRNDPDIIL